MAKSVTSIEVTRRFSDVTLPKVGFQKGKKIYGKSEIREKIFLFFLFFHFFHFSFCSYKI